MIVVVMMVVFMVVVVMVMMMMIVVVMMVVVVMVMMMIVVVMMVVFMVVVMMVMMMIVVVMMVMMMIVVVMMVVVVMVMMMMIVVVMMVMMMIVVVMMVMMMIVVVMMMPGQTDPKGGSSFGITPWGRTTALMHQVLHQSQDAAHRTLPTGRCPQDANHRTLPTGRCRQDANHRTLPTGFCLRESFDCHGVTQNGSGSSSVTSPTFVLVETTNESVCGGTVVSTKMNGLSSHVQKAWCHSTSTPTAPSAGTVVAYIQKLLQYMAIPSTGMRLTAHQVFYKAPRHLHGMYLNQTGSQLVRSDCVIDEKTVVLQKKDNEGFGFVLRGAKGRRGATPLPRNPTCEVVVCPVPTPHSAC
ncbi:hypothetical protein NFI96_021132, partial [Prochilodus magdalenae]